MIDRIANAAATCGRAHDQLGELIRGAKSTPSDVQILVQEVEGLCRILGELESALKNKKYNEELLLNLRTVCGGFSDLKSLVCRIKNGDEKSTQQSENWRLVSREKRAAALMSRLEVYRVALGKISHISADVQASDKNTTSQFEETMREIAQIFSQQDEENDIAKYPEFLRPLIKRHISGRSAGYSLVSTSRALDREKDTASENGYHHQVYSPSESPRFVHKQQAVYGNVIQMRREMRSVHRRAAKEKGSIPLV